MASAASKTERDDDRTPVGPVLLIGPGRDQIAPYAQRLRNRGAEVLEFSEAPPPEVLRTAPCALFLDWGWAPNQRATRRAGIVAALVEAGSVRILRACSATEADRVIGRLLP